VRSGVPLEVECVVESLAAEGAKVAFHVAVALHVPVEQSQQAERLLAHSADSGTRSVATIKLCLKPYSFPNKIQ
jgi:23S rRNA A2030 N6-methylase RlmJ